MDSIFDIFLLISIKYWNEILKNAKIQYNNSFLLLNLSIVNPIPFNENELYLFIGEIKINV